MDAASLESILFWLTVFSYAGGFCFHLFGIVRGKASGPTLSVWMLRGGLALHTATGIARWVSSGHAPVTDTYELNLTGTWFTMLVFLLFERLGKADRSIGLVVAPIVFLVLGQGYAVKSEAGPMGPAYQSPWLWVHVIFAWLAFGCYAVATGAAIMLLVKNRSPGWKPATRMPEPAALDVSIYRFTILGFINHAMMLVAGAIWAKKLWGRYWSWDALETWSLIAFLFYAFCLHARTFLKWKLTRAAWLTVAGLLILAVSFWGVDLFAPGRHPGP